VTQGFNLGDRDAKKTSKDLVTDTDQYLSHLGLAMMAVTGEGV
jgi:hypothetical protein